MPAHRRGVLRDGGIPTVEPFRRGARPRRRGTIGGIYGIGGGSLLSPILVGRGIPVSTVAPAALTSTFVTSIVGATTYVVLALTTSGHDIEPAWMIGIISGLGGLCGGYLGAHLQPFLPEKALRVCLGISAIVTAVLYAVQAVS